MQDRMHVHSIRARSLRTAWNAAPRASPHPVSGRLPQASGATALGDETIAVRNSRCPGGPAILCIRSQMPGFLAGIKDGEFDYVPS